MTSEMSSSSIVPAREGGDLSCWALVWGAATVRLFAESRPSLSSAGEPDLLPLLYVVVVFLMVSVFCLSEESLGVPSS